ncbi:MAG: RNA methyltransferase [Bacteroidetes bacterium]|nr:RNA methyltransferase [Bacteroidota bacterium]MBU1717655.1 RNA methyltransferase [Bacteroidota bacterium]
MGNLQKSDETSELIDYLAQFVTPERWAKFQNIILDRSRYMTIILEDIFQPHNASAVLRTSDCFGVQDVHIIENRNKYRVNPDVALGAAQWINLIRHDSAENNTLPCFEHLKHKGYRIVATTLHTNGYTLENFPVEKGPFALLFGNELEGLSETALQHADEYLKIPMVGFTESLNISVSAGICMHYLSMKIRQSGKAWELTESEKQEILLLWLRNSLKNPELIEKRYFSERVKK